jgi:hypothetical protein
LTVSLQPTESLRRDTNELVKSGHTHNSHDDPRVTIRTSPSVTVVVGLRRLEAGHDCRVDVARVMPPEILGGARQHGNTCISSFLYPTGSLELVN